MIKAKLKYHENDKTKIVRTLIENDTEIKRMPYESYSIYQSIICIFNDTKHMNSVLLCLNQGSYHGVNLVRFRKVFDFKSWWKGEK